LIYPGTDIGKGSETGNLKKCLELKLGYLQVGGALMEKITGIVSRLDFVMIQSGLEIII
jgi:hypothetical protein